MMKLLRFHVSGLTIWKRLQGGESFFQFFLYCYLYNLPAFCYSIHNIEDYSFL